MGIFKRTARVIQDQVKGRLTTEPDAEQQLQTVFQELISRMSEVKLLLGEVASQLERLQHEMASLADRIANLERDAQEALEQGDEERAREILGRKRRIAEQLEEVSGRARLLRRKLDGLQDAQDELRDHIRAFREQRDQVETRFSVASAELVLHKAEVAVQAATNQGVSALANEARLAEARLEVSGGIDEQLERLSKDHRE